MSSLSEFFDRHASQWDAHERADMGLRLERVILEAQIGPGQQVLDVGCGTGVLIPGLLRAMEGAGAICAIDISAAMLEVAQAKGFPDSVSFKLCAIEDFQLAGQLFDRVLCNAVFPHLANKAAALRRIHSLLRPGGSIVISHPVGRAAVNQVHAASGPEVAQDLVPAPGELRELLTSAGFSEVSVIDEPEFHLAKGYKC
jgi:2-polyprenyl-3-methyl-5-hydroxy-6-metoxy-1,4-benzoquinol methylase